VHRAAEQLRASTSGKGAIITSTSLSNQEYDLVRRLGEKTGMDVFHVSHDPAERIAEPHAVAGSFTKGEIPVDPLRDLIEGLSAASLSELSSATSIVLFNIRPGRSFPILEMKIRHAAEGGARLFIINSRPIRLDDCAESVFRIREGDYGYFLKLAGALRVSRHAGVNVEVRNHFLEEDPVGDPLSNLRIKPSKLHSFVRALGKPTVYVTDEDATSPGELRAFLTHALIRGGTSRVLRLRRGTNPKGASRRGPNLPLNGDLLDPYDTLMVYNLPQLFPLQCSRLIQIGFTPFDGYRGDGVFIPSSSLLETGGSVFRYDGREASIPRVLANPAGLDNQRTLEALLRGT
jgi:hypothetical protein